jgi:hypothetical protein
LPTGNLDQHLKAALGHRRLGLWTSYAEIAASCFIEGGPGGLYLVEQCLPPSYISAVITDKTLHITGKPVPCSSSENSVRVAQQKDRFPFSRSFRRQAPKLVKCISNINLLTHQAQSP